MSSNSESTVNVSVRLSEMARQDPDGVAVVEPGKRSRRGEYRYRQVTFRELDEDTERIAAGLHKLGVRSGTRLVLLVPPGIDFVAIVFALFKVGAVIVLIDPGMGRNDLLNCLEECDPEGFIAVPKAHLARTIMCRRFRRATINVTVGRRLFWGGATLTALRKSEIGGFQPARTGAREPAAVIFTSGSTGPPKGVLYLQGNFDQQVEQIRDYYGIAAGEIDLPGFPLFALFNAAMGVTTVFPDMDFSRPAQADPRNIITAATDWNVTQAFGSPALWNLVGRYCQDHAVRLPTLRRVLSAGAPVPLHVLENMKGVIHPDGDVHTPYGATEALPIASTSASEVINETAKSSGEGAGTCVGHRFPGIQWKVIRIDDEPIGHIDAIEELPPGEIGELIVCGPVVTPRYVTRVEANQLHKIEDGESVWHRMGDVGYLDRSDRFWFCGRKSQRIRHTHGTLYTVPVESIINQHRQVYRSALVGYGPQGRQVAVLVVETWPEFRPASRRQEEQLIAELWDVLRSHKLAQEIRDILLHPSLPVDVRHNSKIFREQLGEWAMKEREK